MSRVCHAENCGRELFGNSFVKCANVMCAASCHLECAEVGCEVNGWIIRRWMCSGCLERECSTNGIELSPKPQERSNDANLELNNLPVTYLQRKSFENLNPEWCKRCHVSCVYSQRIRYSSYDLVTYRCEHHEYTSCIPHGTSSFSLNEHFETEPQRKHVLKKRSMSLYDLHGVTVNKSTCDSKVNSILDKLISVIKGSVSCTSSPKSRRKSSVWYGKADGNHGNYHPPVDAKTSQYTHQDAAQHFDKQLQRPLESIELIPLEYSEFFCTIKDDPLDNAEIIVLEENIQTNKMSKNANGDSKSNHNGSIHLFSIHSCRQIDDVEFCNETTSCYYDRHQSPFHFKPDLVTIAKIDCFSHNDRNIMSFPYKQVTKEDDEYSKMHEEVLEELLNKSTAQDSFKTGIETTCFGYAEEEDEYSKMYERELEESMFVNDGAISANFETTELNSFGSNSRRDTSRRDGTTGWYCQEANTCQCHDGDVGLMYDGRAIDHTKTTRSPQIYEEEFENALETDWLNDFDPYNLPTQEDAGERGSSFQKRFQTPTKTKKSDRPVCSRIELDPDNDENVVRRRASGVYTALVARVLDEVS
ncbi:hypothetical protein GE061_012561 [Apolygus lucorum]|uniref:Uncharacterized protein n=1 Tax=Apolygus lucorum TaxID=248454 RepID=A0A8S9XSW5_APOLU|nr:hypothetical protein GE061_012561 [Apolygus lucorum]